MPYQSPPIAPYRTLADEYQHNSLCISFSSSFIRDSIKKKVEDFEPILLLDASSNNTIILQICQLFQTSYKESASLIKFTDRFKLSAIANIYQEEGVNIIFHEGK